jgi:hypothetical protein
MTFKRNGKQPRKSSTNRRALSTRFNPRSASTINSATGSSPAISAGPAPDHPPPVPVYGDKWEYRTYSAAFTEAQPNEGVQFRANGFNTPGAFFVDKIQVWRLFSTEGTGINTGFYQINSTDLGNNQVVNVEDYGTATSLPGVTFKVPLGHAREVNDTLQDILVDAKPAIQGSQKASFVAHLHCWVQV